MRVNRLSTSAAELRDGHASAWTRVEENTLALSPSPIALTESVSPYMSRTTGHGKVNRLNVRLAHDGKIFSLRLSWSDPDRDDELNDLDQFADAVSVMFPLSRDSSAFTMGSSDKPVNAWLWQADEEKPFDVIATGYATSTRRTADGSGLMTSSYHEDGRWVVVLQRPMTAAGRDYINIKAGADLGIAFAVWEGSNNERSAAKAVSGEFTNISVDV